MKAHTENLDEEQRIYISYASVPQVARYFTLALGWLHGKVGKHYHEYE
jgi:hypothetical protein